MSSLTAEVSRVMFIIKVSHGGQKLRFVRMKFCLMFCQQFTPLKG